jgi:hypothetical protein
MKKIIVISALATFIFACSPDKPKTTDTGSGAGNELLKDDAAKSALDAKGVGKFSNVAIDPNLDPKMAALGTGIYDLKCSSCHKLTGEKLVGPGWHEVTKRRTPEWIMNFATNTDEMLNKDPEAQALLETCLVRMPNQSLSDDDARNVYEFMRKNDGVK